MLHRTLISSFVIGASLVASSATLAAPESPTIAQFLSIRTPGSVDIAPDGTVYFRDWPDGVNQLYRRPANSAPTAPAKRLTDYADGLSSYSLAPNGKWITLSAAVGGNEDTNVWLLNTSTDEIKPILQNSAVQFSVNTWLQDSSGFL